MLTPVADSAKSSTLRYAFVLGCIGFITTFGAHIVVVNLPFYAVNAGIGFAMIGVLIAVYDFAEILAKPVFGGLADKKGMKKALLAGILLFTFSSLLYPFVSPKLLILVRFLQGLGAAALSAVSLAMVGIFYKETKGKAYGIYNAIKGAGYVVSPLVGGAIVLKSDFAAIFYASAIIGALGFLLALSLPADKEKGEDVFDDDDDFSLRSLLSVFKNKTLMPWFLMIVINMFFVGILFGFLPARFQQLGYDAWHTGIIVSLTSVSYLLIQPVAGMLADKWNAVVTLRAGMLLSCVSIVAVAFLHGWMLIVVCILAGIGIGTVWTNCDALISHLTPEHEMGATMGVAGSFKELGDMVGPLLMGALSQMLGLQWGFIICSIFGAIAVIVTIFSSTQTAQRPVG